MPRRHLPGQQLVDVACASCRDSRSASYAARCGHVSRTPAAGPPGRASAERMATGDRLSVDREPALLGRVQPVASNRRGRGRAGSTRSGPAKPMRQLLRQVRRGPGGLRADGQHVRYGVVREHDSTPSPGTINGMLAPSRAPPAP